MRHQVHGKKLNRSSGHRKALYRNLVQSLVEHERITTTLPKAKAIRPVAEKLITRAKQQDLASRRAVLAYIPSVDVADKLFSVLGVRFAERPGGYTRIIKTGRRAGDGAEMAILELVELSAPTAGKKAQKATKKATASKKAAPARRTRTTAKKAEETPSEATESES
jgi:large subunit ribosomal protein L17